MHAERTVYKSVYFPGQKSVFVCLFPWRPLLITLFTHMPKPWVCLCIHVFNVFTVCCRTVLFSGFYIACPTCHQVTEI